MAQSLVTGGGGFVGRFVVRQLLERGESVRVLGRREYPFLEGAECVVRDVADPRAVAAAAAGCDAVYHVAAKPGVWGPRAEYERTNVEGTRNVIDACRTHGVGRLIFTSSPSVVFDGRDHIDADESLPYPEAEDYLCDYPRTNAEAERMVLAADEPGRLRTVALRPHLVFGPEDNSLTPRVLSRADAGRLAIVGRGRNEVSVSYVENVAASHVQAADELAADARCGGRAYFINEPRPVAVEDWINTILGFGDRPPCRRHVPLWAAYAIGSMLETLFAITGRTAEPPMTRFVALQLGRSHTYDTSAAQRDFGYRPVVAWDEALWRTRQWFQDHPPSRVD